MRKFIVHVLKVAILGIIIGAGAVFILSAGEPGSAAFGALIGGVPGALIGMYTGIGRGRHPGAFTSFADSAIGDGNSASLGGYIDAGGFGAGGADAGAADGGGI